MPGGASLYSLSVAWASIWGPLALKVWRHIFGFVLLLPSESNLRINKRVLLFTRPIFVFEGVNAIQGIFVLYFTDPFK